MAATKGAASAMAGSASASPRLMKLLPVPVAVPGWGERVARWIAS